ncbi:acyltransferase family protein [Rhodococcus sp. MSC1_016]|jgi:peptidoglycan/LPS O-acetylase OafA/YrhL|uniref:acyltransferase family protein n=1 Tax=Rhodococcus sp. MSC1_016 TaxID=2909266 RepID=UPI00202E5484|nr:acyltransferase family protein [Rhodococcus sp. MSC1_016]
MVTVSGSAVLHPIVKRRVKTKPRSKQRLDIQGLRMLAVMLVLLDHLFGWPRGGFIGVDVFFVISGFLITGQLLKTLDQTGRISFSDFYRNRLRRIFPAATMVLVGTLIIAYPVFSAARFKSAVVDGGWAFAFIANWRFGLEGADYFNSDRPVSPFQHYWSLSVEEQFYVVWPIIILLVGLLVTRKSLANRARGIITASVMCAIIAISFTVALMQSATQPTWAYFSTFTRVWELGVGSLLAICLKSLNRMPDRARPYFAWAGILAIGVGAFGTSESSGFPAPAAALPVMGAALIISAGVNGDHRFLQPITNRVSVYIGDISYSLYLVHWPIIVVLGALMEEDIYFYATALALTFGFSIASYHLIENPIRRSNWLVPSGLQKPMKKKRFGKRIAFPVVTRTGPAQHAGIAALILVTIGLSIYAVRPVEVAAVPDRKLSSPFHAENEAAGAISLGPAGTALAQQIDAAVGMVEWPELQPSMDDAIAGLKAIPEAIACGSVSTSTIPTCTWGDPAAPREMMVLGDSIAMSYMGPLKKFAESSEGQWKVQSGATAGCSFVDITVPLKDAAVSAACPDRKRDAIRTVNEIRPDVVVISNIYGGFPPEEWSAGIRRLTDQFAENVGKIVLLSAPPADVNIADCYTRLSRPTDCISRVTSSWFERSAAEEALAASLNAVYIDTRQLFCTPDNYCPSFVGNTPMKSDSAHITPEYGHLIAPALAEWLRNAGL